MSFATKTGRGEQIKMGPFQMGLLVGFEGDAHAARPLECGQGARKNRDAASGAPRFGEQQVQRSRDEENMLQRLVRKTRDPNGSGTARGWRTMALLGALILGGGFPPEVKAGLAFGDDFEDSTPRCPWFLDNTLSGARYAVIEPNARFGSRALRYHLTATATGQQEAVGQLLSAINLDPSGVTNLVLQFDFYVSSPAAAVKKAFNFGVGSSMGTPLTDHNQMATLGADDRSFNAYIGWQTQYCRIQYQFSVESDGHGRGGTLVAVDPAPGMSIPPETIGTARMTLTRGATNYDIRVQYRVGTNDFVTGATGTYGVIATNWDQVLVGFGIHGTSDGQSDIYLDNLRIYTNHAPADIPPADGFRLLGISAARAAPVRVFYPADTNHYYILHAAALTNLSALTPTNLTLGTSGVGVLTGPTNPATAGGTIFRVGRVPISQPLDLDGDGLDDVFELTHAPALDPLNPDDGSPQVAYFPTAVVDGDPEAPVINADTGPFSKGGANTFPIGVPGKSIQHPLLCRRVVWSALETSPDQYNFSQFESDLANARSVTGLVWWAAYSMRSAERNGGTWVPAYLAVPPYGQMVNGTWLPDFNHPYYKERWQALIREIGRRYANEPRLYGFDMRGWGPYGENNTWRGSDNNLPPYTVYESNRLFYIDTYRAVFTNQQLFVMIDDLYTVNYVLNLSTNEQPIPIGIRADSWGNPARDSDRGDFAAAYPQSLSLYDERWKIAPIGGEPWGIGGCNATLFLTQMTNYHVALMANGNLGSPSDWSTSDQIRFQTAYGLVGYRYAIERVSAPTRVRGGGLLLVEASWLNRGLAPTYWPWQAEWRLYNSAGVKVWSAASGINLRQVLPAPSAVARTDQYVLPSLPAGRYVLRLAVLEPRGVLPPMVLAIKGRTADGSYNLGPNGSEVAITVQP